MPLIGELLTKITADTSDFNSKIRGAEQQASGFGQKASKGIGLLSTAIRGLGLIGGTFAIKKMVEDVGALNDETAKLGISIEAFQYLAKATDDAGLSADGLQNALARMQKTLGDAIGGNATAIKAFTDLNLSVTDLAKLSPDQQYLAIGEAIGKLGDRSLEAAAAQNIFGRAGKDSLGFFNTNMKEAVKNATDLGFAVGTIQAEQLDKLAEKADEFSKVLVGAGKNLLAELAPVGIYLIGIAEKFAGTLKSAVAKISDGISQGATAFDNQSKGVGRFFQGVSNWFSNNGKDTPKFALDLTITASPEFAAIIKQTVDSQVNATISTAAAAIGGARR